jgi:hypothetical protein
MATPAQIAANRRNADKSTGPRTEAGKAASRMNALQHGIDACSSVLPGEDPAEFEALAAAYRERYQPRTPEEHFLVDTLARSEWNRRRYARIQAELTARLLDAMDPADRSLGALFLPDNPAARALNRVIRRYEAAENSWFRALRELRRIINREAEEAAAARQSTRPEPENWLRSDNPPKPVPASSPTQLRPAPDPGINLALRL